LNIHLNDFKSSNFPINFVKKIKKHYKLIVSNNKISVFQDYKLHHDLKKFLLGKNEFLKLEEQQDQENEEKQTQKYIKKIDHINDN